MAKKVVLAGACRTAIGSMGGALSNVPAAELGAVVIKEALNYLLEDASDVIRMVALINSSELLDLEKQCAEAYPTNIDMVPFNRYKLIMSINTILKEADYRYGIKLNWWDTIIKRASKQHFTELFYRALEHSEEKSKITDPQ